MKFKIIVTMDDGAWDNGTVTNVAEAVADEIRVGTVYHPQIENPVGCIERIEIYREEEPLATRR